MDSIDGGNIVGVTPFRASRGGGSWPCGVCGGPHPVTDSHRILVSRGRWVESVIACPRCGDAARAKRRDSRFDESASA